MVVGGGVRDMRLMEGRLVLKSPAIITQRRVERGFVKPADHIPGSMLRGAILTALFRSGMLSQADLKREAEEPSLLASPAYPVWNSARSAPATPFMFYCRRCGTVIDATHESTDMLRRDQEPSLPLLHKCGEPFKPLYGSLIMGANGKLKGVRVHTFRASSAAIGKDRGSIVREMLFDYEAIAEGTEFWAWILAPDWLHTTRIEVAVGRGQSRGFGWGELRLEPTSQPPQQTQEVFVAFSPLLALQSLQWGGCTVTQMKIFGRTIRQQAGWDYAYGFRPIIELAGRGSIILAKVSGEAAAMLRVGLPVKVAGSWLTGINALLSVNDYYRVLGD
jgi:hypothetical protein